ncbi:MAG TPA: methyltransferase [Gaiellaceae bacterium]|jgi:release factor glutamine methyltransferase|nr:methyltransferase [Gaiellaceae bacterium]
MGHVSFNGLRLLSAPGQVMTPRPTSEQLVAAAAARVGTRRARIADVGTGSGAIAIAIATVCPRAEVWATDASRCSVALARANVRRHRLEGRVVVRYGDLLGPVPGLLDLIVANLPYVAASTAGDHPDLEREPFAAVFAPGDGLEPYRRLVDTAPARLAENGVLLLQLHRRVVAAGRPSCRRSARRWTGPLSADRRVLLLPTKSSELRRDALALSVAFAASRRR